MRAASGPHDLARWDGGTPAPDGIGAPAWLKAQPRATARSRPDAARPAQQPRGRGALFAPVPHLRLDRSVLRARRVQGRRAQGLVAHARAPAVLRDWLARALGLRAAQVTVFHRQGSGAYGHNTADDAAFDAAFIAHAHAGPHRARAMDARGRIRWRRRSAPPWRSSCAPCSTTGNKPGRLDDRDLEPAARAASGHERQFQSHRRRGAARCAALRTSSTTCRTSAAAARPATAMPIYDLPRHRLIHHHAAACCRCAPRRCAGSAPGPTCSRSSRSWTNWPRPPARTR